MGLFATGFGFAQGWGGAKQEEGSLGRELRRRGPVEILVVQSVDHPVSRQIKQGFQERLMEEKGLHETLGEKEGLQEGLAEKEGLQGGLGEKKGLHLGHLTEKGLQFRFVTYDLKGKLANSRVLAQLLSCKEADVVLAIGASAAQTAVLASRLKEQIAAKGEGGEVVEAQVGPEREAVSTQCGLMREKAASQTGLAAPRPIVFTAVMDPFCLHILPKNKPNDPLGPVYGVLDPPPIQDQLRLIRLVMPGLERLGVVYSEDAVAVVKLVEDLKEMAPVFGIEVMAVPIRSLEGVAGAYTALAPEVEAFFMPLDDRLLVQVDLILALANQYFLPVFASDTASVERGALAGLGYNYHEAGRIAAELALRALDTASEGDQPKGQDLPRLVQQKQRLTLNQKTARRLRIVFPASALREADSLLD